MLICVFTGFASGLPLFILITLIPAWLRSEQVDLKSIGFFALIQLPYTWKFIWSPLLDRYALTRLGRRRSWMLIAQLLLLVSIPAFGMLQPQADLWTIAYLAVAISLFSATADIAIDAFRREILTDAELGLGNAVHVNAYRIAGLVPGSLSLVLADHMSWSGVYLVTALFMLPGIVMTMLVKEPAQSSARPRTLREAIVEPFHEFISRRGWRSAATVLVFVILYKLGDSMATALATPFYLDMGFSKTEVGLVAKNAGLWGYVTGGMIGGIWMLKLGINRGLWVFGVAQAVMILGFAWMAQLGHIDHAAKLVALGVVIFSEALGSGLGTAAFVAYIARETNPAYTATQFALFTSLAALPRTVISASTGWMVEQLGWYTFFWLCFALAWPGMLLLARIAPWREKLPSSS
ncbi:MAG: AmpG family muropeptide MFS transporter [Betaproteobacteria bacterium]